jgi:hypothetical protein
MEARITEAININTIIERKILIRNDSVAILKLLNILRLISFSNSFVKFKPKHNQNGKQEDAKHTIDPINSIF